MLLMGGGGGRRRAGVGRTGGVDGMLSPQNQLPVSPPPPRAFVPSLAESEVQACYQEPQHLNNFSSRVLRPPAHRLS